MLAYKKRETSLMYSGYKTHDKINHKTVAEGGARKWKAFEVKRIVDNKRMGS